MKRVPAFLIALIFTLAPPVLAEKASLTDTDLDEIAAGDWVVIDPETQEVVDGIHHNNNDIDLEEESQTEIQAVNNVNAVDSAVAAQTNIATVTGDPSNNVGVYGSNSANIANYNPSESGSFSSKSVSQEEFGLDKFEIEKKSFSLSETKDAGSTFSLVETNDIVETLDIVSAFAAAGEEECGDCESEWVIAGVSLVDYDYLEDYDKKIDKDTWSKEDKSIEKEEFGLETTNISKSQLEVEEKTKSFRKNLSENNHLNLEDVSQKNIQVVSNLNAVGSGAAAQSNIASNVGVTGTISHSNAATVANGM